MSEKILYYIEHSKYALYITTVCIRYTHTLYHSQRYVKKIRYHETDPKLSDTFEHCINDHSMSERNNCSFHNTSTSFINSSDMSLDTLGLNPVIEVPWSAGATRHRRTSVWNFAIVQELEQFLIFFHFVPMCNCMVTILRCLCTTH